MAEYAYDLHIHSALSPCADDDMTPNNIVNMSLIKGLDIIALTDHNSILNAQATITAGEANGLLVIPGMEVETSEEIHVVCLFPSIEAAQAVYQYVSSHMPPIKNKPEIFGCQNIMNDQDAVVGIEDQMLVTASQIGIYDLFNAVKTSGGVAVPAHVDRDSYSILASLGYIPEDLPVSYIEVSKRSTPVDVISTYHLDSYGILRSSDAHYLEDISERENFMHLEEKSAGALIQKLLSYRAT